MIVVLRFQVFYFCFFFCRCFISSYLEQESRHSLSTSTKNQVWKNEFFVFLVSRELVKNKILKELKICHPPKLGHHHYSFLGSQTQFWGILMYCIKSLIFFGVNQLTVGFVSDKKIQFYFSKYFGFGVFLGSS